MAPSCAGERVAAGGLHVGCWHIEVKPDLTLDEAVRCASSNSVAAIFHREGGRGVARILVGEALSSRPERKAHSGDDVIPGPLLALGVGEENAVNIAAGALRKIATAVKNVIRCSA